MVPDEARSGLVASGCIGFLIGGASVAGAWMLYPPAKGHLWPLATVAIGSIASLVVLYVTASRLDVRQAGDWLVVGYALAVVTAATVVVTGQIADLLRSKEPENIGVKTARVSRVEGNNGSRGTWRETHA